jgi:PPOX class probable F420-dependent enzyme
MQMASDPVTALAKKSYISLTTFRRTGVGVPTPVWFVQEADHLFVWTGAATGKAKRIRNNPHVTVAPCTGRGKVTGETWQARATIVPPEQGAKVQALLDRKYWLVKRLLGALNVVVRTVRRRPKPQSVFLRIDFEPASDGPAPARGVE